MGGLKFSVPQVLTKSIFNTVPYNSKRLVQRRNIEEREGGRGEGGEKIYRRYIGNGKSPRARGGTGLSRDFGKNF